MGAARVVAARLARHGWCRCTRYCSDGTPTRGIGQCGDCGRGGAWRGAMRLPRSARSDPVPRRIPLHLARSSQEQRRRGDQGFACHAQMTEDTGRARRRTGGAPFEDALPRKCVAQSRGLARARARGLSAIKVYGGSFRPLFQGCTLEQSCRVVPGICLWVAQGVR